MLRLLTSTLFIFILFSKFPGQSSRFIPSKYVIPVTEPPGVTDKLLKSVTKVTEPSRMKFRPLPDESAGVLKTALATASLMHEVRIIPEWRRC
jgi:hypothetical protein